LIVLMNNARQPAPRLRGSGHSKSPNRKILIRSAARRGCRVPPTGPSNALLEKTSLLRPCPASVRSGNGAGSAILSTEVNRTSGHGPSSRCQRSRLFRPMAKSRSSVFLPG